MFSFNYVQFSCIISLILIAKKIMFLWIQCELINTPWNSSEKSLYYLWIFDLNVILLTLRCVSIDIRIFIYSSLDKKMLFISDNSAEKKLKQIKFKIFIYNYGLFKMFCASFNLFERISVSRKAYLSKKKKKEKRTSRLLNIPLLYVIFNNNNFNNF